MQLTVEFDGANEWVPATRTEPSIQINRDRGVFRRPHFGFRIVAWGHAMRCKLDAYDRPRNATTITPAIASRPPHAVAMPGRSPVSTTDSSVATAGVR